MNFDFTLFSMRVFLDPPELF